jgi:acetyl esterase
MDYAPGMQTFIDRFTTALPSDFYTRPLAQARALYEDLGTVFPYQVPEGVRVTDEEVTGNGRRLRVRVYRPERVVGRGLLVYIRGGGFVIGSLQTLNPLVAELAAATGLVTVALDFRMAPENPFPAGLEDCYDALCGITGHIGRFGADRDRIVLAGDSSGANMVVALCMMARDRGVPGPRGQALICPVLDFRRWCEGGQDMPLLTGGEMEFFTACYCPDPEQTLHPYVSPLIDGKFHGLPPAYIVGTELDSLLVDAQLYAAKLRKNGVEARLAVEPGLPHAPLRARGLSPDAARLWQSFCTHAARLTGLPRAVATGAPAGRVVTVEGENGAHE